MTVLNDLVAITDLNGNTIMEFNQPPSAGVRWWCDEMTGWLSTADPETSITNYGDSDGATAGNRFPLKERYVTLQGACQTSSRFLLEQQMDKITGSLKTHEDVYLVRHGPTPKRMKVRLSSSVEIPLEFEQEFRWLATVVALRPFKEALNVISGTVNVYSGGNISRTYSGGAVSDTNWIENSSFEVDATTAVFHFNGSTSTRSTAQFVSGGASLRVVSSVTADSGPGIKTPNRSPDGYDPVPPHGTVWLRGNVGGEVVRTWIRAYYTDNTTSEGTRTSRTLTAAWQSFNDTMDPDETKAVRYYEYLIRAPGTTSLTWFIDRVHISLSGGYTAAFTGNTPDQFHTGTAYLSPVSKIAIQGSRDYGTDYARTWEASAAPGEEQSVDFVNVDNKGNATAFPVTTITGPLPSGSWEIRNETTQERLSFRVDIPANTTFVIDHEARTAIMNGQHVEHKKDGQWWGLAPGVNQLRLVADSFDIAPEATFDVHSTWRN